MEVYFKWDGSPAPSRKEADWVVALAKDRRSFWAYSNWDGGIGVYIEQGPALSYAIPHGRDDTVLWVLKAFLPVIFDINTLAELLIAYERDAAFDFLHKKPFKPASLYGKPEELGFEIRAVQNMEVVEVIRPQPIKGLKYARPGDPIIITRMVRREVGPVWLGPEALAPVYAKVPHGELHGCVVYDAWGRPAELRPITASEVAPRTLWLEVPRVEIREGELPGAGWVICWTWAKPKLNVDFYAYAHFREYGTALLVKGYVETLTNNKVKDLIIAISMRRSANPPVWVPNFNAALADMLTRGEPQEETA